MFLAFGGVSFSQQRGRVRHRAQGRSQWSTGDLVVFQDATQQRQAKRRASEPEDTRPLEPKVNETGRGGECQMETLADGCRGMKSLRCGHAAAIALFLVFANHCGGSVPSPAPR